MERNLHAKISSWVRQARHRARRYKCICRLDLSAALRLVEDSNCKCTYCDQPCCGLDHAFPLSDKAPNVLANTVPICQVCKAQKKQQDLVAYHETGHISNDRYLAVLRWMLSHDGAVEMREHLKKITGIGLDSIGCSS